jgi:hypothetical protein
LDNRHHAALLIAFSMWQPLTDDPERITETASIEAVLALGKREENEVGFSHQL